MAILVVSWFVAVLVANVWLFATWRVTSVRATSAHTFKNLIMRDRYLILFSLLGASMFILRGPYGEFFAVAAWVAVLVLPVLASYSTRVRSAVDAGIRVKEHRS